MHKPWPWQAAGTQAMAVVAHSLAFIPALQSGRPAASTSLPRPQHPPSPPPTSTCTFSIYTGAMGMSAAAMACDESPLQRRRWRTRSGVQPSATRARGRGPLHVWEASRPAAGGGDGLL